MSPLEPAHLGLATIATIGAAVVHAWPLSAALGIAMAVDIVYLTSWGWPGSVVASFAGPASVVVAALLTYRVRWHHVALLLAPFLPLVDCVLVYGPRLGSAGIAWLVAGAHVYAALVGFVVLIRGLARASRVHSRLVGLFVATSAPGAYGWSCLARGGSMRSAAVLDCVFLAAIVVWSVAAWARRQNT